MKKPLLLLASLAMSVASFAQSWSEPKLEITPKDYVQEFKASVLADSLRGDSTFYYLYNIGGEGFLTGGTAPTHSQWTTNAVLSETGGNLIMISKYELSETPKTDAPTNVGSSEPAEWDGKTYVINNWWNNKWMQIILTSENGSFVDRASQIDYKWEIIPQGNGVYRIKTADVNPNFNDKVFGYTSYFAWDELDTDYGTSGIKAITPGLDVNDADVIAHADWAFIDPIVMDIYQARVKLYEALNTAYDEGADYTAALAVYNDASATVEQIEAAVVALRKAINDKIFGDVTEDNPLDATDWIVNADFSAGNASGWNVGFEKDKNATNIGYQGNKDYTNGEVKISKFIEAWASNTSAFNPNVDAALHAIGVGSLTQTIENMPAGKYKFTVDCIANQQYVASANPVTGVQLFAKGGNIDVYKPIATGNELPEHFEITFVNDGSDITLGLRTTEECTANWIAADNFTLTYYGATDEDPYKVVLEAAIAAALEAHPLEELDDVKAYVGDKKVYEDAISEAQAATADYLDYVDSISNATKVLETSIAAYGAYIAEVERIREYLAGHELEAEESYYLQDYLMDDSYEPGDDFVNGNAYYILENCQLNVEEIKAETDTIGKILLLAIANSLVPGKDCSDMLVNASFAQGFTGWTNTAGNVGDFSKVDDSLPNNVEAYETEVNCYQVITGVPDGVYSLSVKGFVRPGGNGTYTGDEPAEVYLFMNDYQTPVQNIVAGALPENEAEDGENCYLTQKYKDGAGNNLLDYLVANAGYVPNGMIGAAVAFKAGRYEQKVYGLVEGGTMKVGVTTNGEKLGSGHWALWADFKLTYEGAGSDATKVMLKAALENLETYLKNYGDGMTEKCIEDANKVIAAAEAAIEEGDEAKMTAVITDVQAALAAAQENVAVVKEFLALETKLYVALEAEDANPAGIAAFDDIKDDVYDYVNLSTEELKALMEKMQEVIDLANIPMFDLASDDNPVDCTKLIKNADIEEGATVAWQYRKKEGNGPNLDKGVEDTKSIEFWAEKAENLEFAIWQELPGLAAGTYKLEAQAANALNGQAVAKDSLGNDNTGRAYLYAITSSETGASVPVEVVEGDATPQVKNYEVIFTVAEGDTVHVGFTTVGTMAARWFVADNFKLTYYGANSSQTASEDIGDVATDIDDIDGAEDVPVAIYTVAGVKVETLQKGINIVLYKNGTTKKVIR